MATKEDDADSKTLVRQPVTTQPATRATVAEDSFLATVDARRAAPISRRRALASLAAIPFAAAAALTLPTFGAVVAAEVVTAVIAVVGIVMALTRMFGQRGPGLGDLMNVQIRLLVNISRQLENVQIGINAILSRLDELERLVGAVPTKTVEAMGKHRILGEVRLYTEMMKTRADAKQAKLLESTLQQRYGATITTDIITPVRLARADLMSIDSVFNVPLIASALQIEVHSMLMAGSDRHQLGAVVASYKEWFATTRAAIDRAIDARRAERATLVAELEALRFSSACALDREITERRKTPPRVSRAQRESGQEPSYDATYKFYRSHGDIFDFSYARAPRDLSKEAAVLQEGVTHFMAAGVLTAADLPVTVSAVEIGRTRYWVEDEDSRRQSNTSRIPATEIQTWVEKVQYCPDGPIRMAPRATDIERSLDESGKSLIALAGLKVACTSAIESCDKFSNNLRTMALERK